jgi:hypothetical protein
LVPVSDKGNLIIAPLKNKELVNIGRGRLGNAPAALFQILLWAAENWHFPPLDLRCGGTIKEGDQGVSDEMEADA